MRRLDDETLMAYADAALRGEERRLIEAALRQDSCARRRVALFRLTADLARHAFAEPMWRDPPLRLVDTLLVSKLELRVKKAAWPQLTLYPGKSWRPVALAASIAAIAAALGSYVMLLPPADHDVSLGPVKQGSTLAAVLDTYQSGLTGTNAQFALVATLKDNRGNACLKVDVFDQRPAAVPSAVLVACRDESRRWIVVGAVRPKSVDSARVEPYYVPTDDAAHAALAGVLNMIGATQRASAIKSEGKVQ